MVGNMIQGMHVHSVSHLVLVEDTCVQTLLGKLRHSEVVALLELVL